MNTPTRLPAEVEEALEYAAEGLGYYDDKFGTVEWRVRAAISNALALQKASAIELGRKMEREKIKQEIDSLIDGHYDNPNLAKDIEKLFEDIDYLEALQPGQEGGEV